MVKFIIVNSIAITTLFGTQSTAFVSNTVSPAHTFVANSASTSNNSQQVKSSLATQLFVENQKKGQASDHENSVADSRRSFFSKAAGSAAIVALGLVDAPEDAKALGSLKKVNAKLSQYGVPTIDKVPDGFSPLAEVWGRGRNRDPLLVTFVHPLDWIVTLPSQDVNGEDGTIQAGEYGKGDTATFFVYSDPGKVENLAEQPKEFFERAIIKSISQKGDNLYQNFKITKVMPKKVDGDDYVICEFKYTLLTGAGFEVDRIGLASVTSTGNSVEILWAASTRQRYKKTEGSLMTIVDSFRCYSGGLDMAKIDYGSVV